jgi:hypothetical protein
MISAKEAMTAFKGSARSLKLKEIDRRSYKTAPLCMSTRGARLATLTQRARAGVRRDVGSDDDYGGDYV